MESGSDAGVVDDASDGSGGDDHGVNSGDNPLYICNDVGDGDGYGRGDGNCDDSCSGYGGCKGDDSGDDSGGGDGCHDGDGDEGDYGYGQSKIDHCCGDDNGGDDGSGGGDAGDVVEVMFMLTVGMVIVILMAMR